MNRILVIGGSGFIGRHVCRTGRLREYSVSSLSLRPPPNPLEGVQYLFGDLTDTEHVKRLFEGRHFEFLVNCGGYINHKPYFSGGKDLIGAHFQGVQNLLDAVNRDVLKRFVQIGSSDEYGSARAPQSEDCREGPISPYSLAKVAATHFLQMLWRTEKFPSVTARLFLAYGPGQDEQRFLPQIIRGCLEGRRFAVSEGGQLRDFCYVDDIVEGVFRMLEAPGVCGRVVNLASGTPVTIRSMIEQVCACVGRGQPDFGQVPYRAGENMALWADTSLARKLLNWAPQISLEEGLANTVQYYRSGNSAI